MRLHIRLCTLLAAVLTLSACTSRMRQPATERSSGPAIDLANAVVRASGGNHWHQVDRLQFTFNVEQDGKTVVSRKHDWDVAKGTDTVTVGNTSTTVSVKTAPPSGDKAATDAYKAWVNDSYWLIAPLKLRDPGVTLTHQGQQQIDGKNYEVLHARFENVGVTSNDQYNFYIDPQSKLVHHWDYMPSSDRKVSGTWEHYQDFAGLMLSTDHRFGPRRIFFTDVKVTR